MIPTDLLAELADLYETIQYSEDPTPAKQAQLIFRSECKKLYEAESATFRSKVTLQAFTAGTVVHEVLAFLKQRASKFPTIQPERSQ